MAAGAATPRESGTASGKALVSLSGGARGWLWRGRRPAQRTADIVIVPAFHLCSALGHFGLELFLRERDGVSQIDEHVRDRAPAPARPVPGIGGIFVRGRCV